MTSTSKDSKVIPLEKSLRDLALLRASDIDIGSLLPTLEDPDTAIQSLVDTSVNRSFELVREARLALKIYNRGEVERQGDRVEDIRSKLEDLLTGLRAT